MDKKTIKEIEDTFGVKIKKDTGGFSKKIVILVILLNAFFTIGVFYAFLKVGSEPTTLIAAWFGFTTIELWSMSKIKRDEIKEGIDED